MVTLEATVARSLALLIPFVGWLILFMIKRNGFESMKARRVSELPSGAPMELHAFSLVASFPALIIVADRSLSVLLETVGVLAVIALSFSLTASLWTTMVNKPGRRNEVRLKYAASGVGFFLLGLVWLLFLIWGEFLGLV